MAGGTGFSSQDAQSDFSKARRGQVLRALVAKVKGGGHPILFLDDVTAALGRTGTRRLGLRSIPLDSIVGTVDRGHGFDGEFRPTTKRVRRRWERIAGATRRGESFPPIDVYRVGTVHFVEDGHHRVSVARQLGHEVIEARVTEIKTRIPPSEIGLTAAHFR
ncbi:MAG: hypothetical protein J0H66_09130 [Solirubrobacterales bacterium]|nr:hypothetical protein [Solirubrobacterales bacterium]OJU95769.1 MAG: hypothetical protein BGO23_09260 [Solirubrobacterales bacterium 67-14]